MLDFICILALLLGFWLPGWLSRREDAAIERKRAEAEKEVIRQEGIRRMKARETASLEARYPDDYWDYDTRMREYVNRSTGERRPKEDFNESILSHRYAAMGTVGNDLKIVTHRVLKPELKSLCNCPSCGAARTSHRCTYCLTVS